MPDPQKPKPRFKAITRITRIHIAPWYRIRYHESSVQCQENHRRYAEEPAHLEVLARPCDIPVQKYPDQALYARDSVEFISKFEEHDYE